MNPFIKKIGLAFIFVLVIGNIYLIYLNQDLKREFKKELLISRSSSLELRALNKEIFNMLDGLSLASEDINNNLDSIYISENTITFEITGDSLNDIEKVENFLTEILNKTKVSMTLLSEGESIKGTLKYGGF